MKKLVFAIVSLLCTVTLPLQAGTPKYTDYVNPFVGTDFHGHTFPGAAYPFGMVQLSPDTREANWDGCSGYHYSDAAIRGFSHTHLSGTGCADLCDILVMPVTGFDTGKEIKVENYCSAFSHSNEQASPGYYKVWLDRWKVSAELTVGRRIAMHHYVFDKNDTPQLVIDLEPRDAVLESYIKVIGDNAVSGLRRSRSWSEDQSVYFYMEFSRPIQTSRIDDSDNGAKALLTFKPGNFLKGRILDNDLVVRVGISSVSEENAKHNMEEDVKWFKNDALGFSLVKEQTATDWNKFLSKIEVSGDEEAMKVFYTALYHTAIAPNLFSDANGEYRGMDNAVHVARGFDRYTVFSLWDTFRALHPLFNIIERTRTVDFIKSFISIYNEAGKMPVWELQGFETNCMIGYNAAPVIADAIAKGIEGFNVQQALDGLVASSNKAEFGIDVYRDNGLVLAEKEHESVSKTLEYANDDWCIAQIANHLSNKRLYKEYMHRAKNWRNVFDPGTGFARPRVNGIMLDPFDPTEVNVHYTEANAWQYSFHVQQDISGLIEACGGEVSMDEWLDDLFSASSETGGWKSADMTGMIGQYAHGNEPSHHIAYLYSYIGKPWKTQRVVRKIMSELYTSKPDGLCGNEDCGQMSAWYVLSSLGIYPVTPGSDIYVLGSPMFKNAVIHLENETDFTIRAPRTSSSNIYVDHVMLNGSPYSKSFIHHSDIQSGSTLVFGMSSQPKKSFGYREEDRPVSECPGIFVENPWFDAHPTFTSFTKVTIKSFDPSYKIMYKVENEGQNTPAEYSLYKSPFNVTRNATVYAYCEDDDGNRSYVAKTSLHKIDNTWNVKMLTKYSRLYTGGGDKAVVDGVRGATNFRLGGWQGYQDCDMELVIDMGKARRIKEISAGFLQDTRSWIIFPVWVEYYGSKDGKTFTKLGRATHDVDAQDYTAQIREMPLKVDTSVRYVKVLAKNFGTLPAWHAGAGGEAHIFVDEVTIK